MFIAYHTHETFTGLNLQDTNSYKVSIQASDIRNNVPQLVCSGVVVIDTSKPQDGWIRDGSGADLSYQDTKLLQVNWGGVKTRYGVRKYDWKVLITPFDTNQTTELMPFTTVHQNTSAQKSFNSITDGSKVKFVVRAYTKAGLFSDLTSDGVVIDTSPPIAGKVYDGDQVGFDLKFAKWAKTFSANWDIFTDSHSPISRYTWAVERVGTGLITSFKDTDLNRISTATNLNLVSGESYCAVVTGYNEAGLPTTVKSDCLLIDHDVPLAGTVNDGHFHDVDYQSEDTMIAANWNGFSDGSKGSGIVEYRYKVAEDGGGIIVPWTSAGNATNITRNGLVLKNNTKYFVTVKAVDAVGLSTDITTDGVTVDTTHPVFTGKVVVTGVNDVKNGTSCVYISSISSVKVQWIGFSDAHSGLQRYEWAIIPADKSLSNSDLTEVSGSNLPTSATFHNLALIQGKEYYVIIRAYNRAKLYKDAYSVLVIPDSTPPSPGEVFDGPTYKVDIDYQAEIHHVYGSWENFPEPHTAVKQYYYAVGSCITGNYHVTENAFVKLHPPTATSFVLSNVTLANGQRYCVKIKAENKAGLFSNEISSDGFIADVTPPDTRNAQVRDGMTGSDIDFQDNTTALSAQWDGFADRESGIHYYEYGIGKSRGRNADVFSFKNIGLNTSATAGGLSLSDDVYYFIVCAVNKAGLRQCLSSDGVLIDFSPPSLGVVHDGIMEPDLKYQSSLSSMAANWEGIWDLESGIAKFEWSIGTSANDKTSVQGYTDAGLSTHVRSKAVLNLLSGTKYYVHLKVTNQAGAVRELVSDGVIADGTPPKPSVIYPGFGSQGEWIYSDQESSFYSGSASSIAAYWTRFAEPESEVWYYKWAIGTSKCGTQVQPLVNIGRLNYANTTTSDLVFRSGIKYYVTVTSRNRAGLVSRSCSDALVFDSTPPRAGKVYVGQSSNKHRTKTFHDGKGIIISWKEFTDRESGISKCNISVENQVGDVLFFHSSNETLGNISLPHHVHLSHGQSYNATVECTNHAGLTSSSSTTFVIDDTPPIQNGPIIAGVSRDQHYQYQSDKTSVTATWPPFTDPESDIRNYQFAMGTRPSLDDIISFEDVHLATRVNKNGLSLLQGAVYHITVIATNFAGSSTNVSSLALRIDTTPPLGVNGCVHDGPSGNDIDFFSPNIDLAAHWEEINDAESSIVESKYCIGTKPRGCQIQATRSVQGNKSFICPTCKANPGERVFVTVTATNGAGLSVTRSSNGMVLDVTAPRMGSVIDGSHVTGVDYNVVLEEWNVSMSWFGVEDPESGVKSCLWRVQDADGYTVLENEISNNTVYGQKKVFTRPQTYLELNFLKNVTYYNVITCWSKAKLHRTARSNGFRVESVWPVPASVRNGKKQGVNLIYTTSARIIGANWDPFTSDMTDPVVDYEWAVGTAVGKNDILRFTSVGLKTSIEKDLAPNAPGVDVLVAGQKHYITIKATSAAGLTSIASSSGFIVDPSPPVKAEVITSHVVTDQKQRIVEIHVSWDGTQDYESGIESSDYCLGTTPLTCVDGATSVGPSTAGTIGPFKPEPQAGYYVTVIVANRAGLTSVMSSKKLIFDSTSPTQGTVVDGLGQDIDFTDSMNSLSVQWEGFEDEETGIASCSWSLIEQSASDNSSAFGNDTVVLTESVPSRGNLTRVNLNLVPGARYVSKITCSNGDGFNSTSFSDGIVVDVTAASSGLVHDGSSLKTDMQYQSSSSKVEAIWEPFKDQESGVVNYRWSIGTSPDRTDVLNFTDVDIKTYAKTSNLTLTHSQRYYVTVEATNGAGITSHGWSDGFLVDISPPLLREVSASNSSEPITTNRNLNPNST